MNLIKRLWTEESGQGMTEYALIIGLIALAAIVTMGFFGESISNWFQSLTDEIDAIGP